MDSHRNPHLQAASQSLSLLRTELDIGFIAKVDLFDLPNKFEDNLFEVVKQRYFLVDGFNLISKDF
jgi:hypothetical protein